MKILLEILLVALLALAAMRLLAPPWRGRVLDLLKAWVTLRAFWLLLEHPVKLDDGTRVEAWRVILDQLRSIDAGTFVGFVLLAAGIKLIGILSSMLRWTLLLRGQGIELPFRHIFGAFMIGRFIGTFLPSTAGLDGYKLYDASRFSGRTVEATAATALEKVIGFSGIFLSFLVALPFGIRIFGDKATLVAAITVPVAVGVIGGLLVLLWFPGIIQWLLQVVPLPGKAQLEGVVMRISRAVSAYRDKHALVLTALALSFLVHFTTAAMYYFTALAIGAQGAEFWPIAFGSSIQIFATVVSPFTIAGEGIREAAQYVLLGHMIGPAAAIVSAALGFWAAEAPTLLGGLFWWLRGADYRPAYCRVNGEQVDYAEAARAAVSLRTPSESAGRAAAGALPPLAARLRESAALGLGTGIVCGVLIGLLEASVIAAGGLGEEAQVLWYAPLAYAVLLGGAGLAGGAVLGLLPMQRAEIRGWTPSLAALALLVPLGLAITLFRVRRDVFLEQAIPLPWLGVILGAALALALLLFLGGRRLFATPLGALVRPLPALALLGLAMAGGALAGSRAATARPAPAVAPAAEGALAGRPNLILVMVDTLRADHLSCYGHPTVKSPALCSLAEDGGTRFTGFSHSSWTKPAAATLLSSLLPSSHGAMSKTAALSADVELLPEALRAAGYVTGGIVSNINLAPSFGFDQGYDEYVYLAPDYLAGARESSSKLIVYQIARKVFFKLVPGHRVGDYYQDSVTVNSVAFDWLARHKDSRFFLFLHYMDPHDPYFEHPYDGRAIARVEADHPDPKLAPEMQRLYRGEIEHLDRNFAKLLDELRRLGLYDRTVIALVSDHGEEFHEHGGFWHGLTLYEEQIHVPFLVKWARGAAAAPPRVEDSLARLIDVAPTLLARAGIPAPAAMQGIDLARPLHERAERDRLLFAEEDHEGNVLRALRSLDWKLIEANEGNPRGLPARELFEVQRDPGETRNLIERHPEVAAELRSHAEAQEKFARSRAVGGGAAAKLTQSQEEALRALGYIE